MFIVSKHNIEANSKYISAIMNMELVKTLKGARRLTGCLASTGCLSISS